MTICFAAGESKTPFMAVQGKTPFLVALGKTSSMVARKLINLCFLLEKTSFKISQSATMILLNLKIMRV